MRISNWGGEQEEIIIPLELDRILMDKLDTQPDCIILPYSGKRLPQNDTSVLKFDSIYICIDTTEQEFNISLAIKIFDDVSIFQIELPDSEYRALVWLLLQYLC